VAVIWSLYRVLVFSLVPGIFNVSSVFGSGILKYRSTVLVSVSVFLTLINSFLGYMAVLWCLKALPRRDAASRCNFQFSLPLPWPRTLVPRSRVMCLGLAGALRHLKF